LDIQRYTKDIQKLIYEVETNRGRDPKIVIDACEKIEEYGEEINDSSLIGYAFFSRGETYYLLNDVANFYSQMLSCLGYLEKSKEWNYVALANNMLGIMSLNRGNAPFALDYYIKAITICQEHNLAETEWMIHMNLGSLYLNIEEYQKSLNHTHNCLKYLEENSQVTGYIERLTSVYLGMARAYIKLESLDKVIELVKKIKQECMPHLQEMDKIVLYCFFARLHQYLGETEARDYWIDLINSKSSSKMPIMDVFDDFYDYLEMLLQTEKYSDFFKIYSLLDELTKKTTIKNLERKLLTLKIRYFRRTEQIEEYKLSSVLYFELSEFMDKENRLMVSNMIVMRNSFMELTQINKKVEKENTFLQKRSETDSLTGLYNRLKLNEYSEEALDRAIKNKSTLAVEILDIDYFKQFNDNYGHQAGDDCIKFLANILLDMSKEEGVFTARYGGDEFVVLYEGFSKDDVIKKAMELRQRVMDANYEHRFSLIDNKVTITQGICFGISAEGQSIYQYLQGADKMLYKVKQKSRNDYMICECLES